MQKERRRELEFFCLQYRDKKEQLKELCYPLGAQNLSGMPRGCETSSSTETSALRLKEVREQLERDIKLIEQTAIYAYPEKYQEFLEYVTTPRNKKAKVKIDYIMEFSGKADIFFEKLNIDK